MSSARSKNLIFSNAITLLKILTISLSIVLSALSFISAKGEVGLNYGIKKAHAASVNDAFDPDVNGTVLSIAVQPDGKILIGGDFTSVGGVTRNSIARLNFDGTLDTSFDPDVRSDPYELIEPIASVNSIAIQPDGKILIGGSFSLVGEFIRKYLARLNPDGTLDHTLDSHFPSGYDSVHTIAIRPDGMIMIGGFLFTGGSHNIALLNSDGTWWEPPGSSPWANNTVYSIAIQPDGNILMGGSFTETNYGPKNKIARLDDFWMYADETFNPNANNDVRSIAIQPDGKILMAGEFTSVGGTTRNRIARLNLDGTLDPGFNPGANGLVQSVALQPDGKILMAGEFTSVGGTTRNRIARLNPDGTLDASFNPGANNHVRSIAIQPDGKIIIGGEFTSVGGVARNRIARVNIDGTLDAKFNPSATTVVLNTHVRSIVAQSDGKILLGGLFDSIGGMNIENIARLNNNGTADSGFNINVNALVSSIVRKPDGNILIGGAFLTAGHEANPHIAQLNPDGSLNRVFHHELRTSWDAPSSFVNSVIALPDGKIIIGGEFVRIGTIGIGGAYTGAIARLNPDSTVDSSFINEIYQFESVQSLAIQQDGKILVGGRLIDDVLTVDNFSRLNPDGSLDTEFEAGVNNNSVYSIAIQSDGKILIGGDFTSVGGVEKNRIARLNPDGTPDTTFNPEANGRVNSITVQSDGKILIGGAFTSISGVARNYIARLNSDGSLDTEFNLAVNNQVRSITIDSDGNILIGGGFTLVEGVERNSIARLSADEPVFQTVNVSEDGKSVNWMRSGPGPEIHKVTFERSFSLDGPWTNLGEASPITGGWQLTGLALPFNQNVYIRAGGYAYGAGAASIAESVKVYHYVDSIPPSVNAGADKLANSMFLQTGEASDLLAGVASVQWTQISGPGTVAFGSPNLATTTMSADLDGEYTVRLTATDNGGNIATDDMTLTWDATAPVVTIDSPIDGAITNQSTVPVTWRADGVIQSTQTTEELTIEGPNTITRTITDEAGNEGAASVIITRDTTAPIVSAGASRLANSQITQTGSASDTNGIATYQWAQISGPGTVSFGSPTSAITTIAADVDGLYELRLSATDNAGHTSLSDMTLTWDTTAPTVVIDSPIDGTITNQSTVPVTWRADGVIQSTQTTEELTIEGPNTITRTITDEAGNEGAASVIITRDTTAPIVSAGASRLANSQITQTGSASDTNGIASYQWTQISGPGTATFGSPNSAATTISASLDGSYTLRLTATDNVGNTATSDMTLTWDITNPTVSAGIDKLAKSEITQTGSASDTNGIASYQWTQISGPGTATFGSPNSAATTISASLDGTYTLRLTATDNAGNTSSDDMTLTWDTTAPIITFDWPVDGVLTNQSTVPVTWRADGVIQNTQTTEELLIEGPNTITRTITDEAGNEGAASVIITRDTTAPTVSAGADRATNSEVTQIGSASDTNGIASYQWSLVSGDLSLGLGTPFDPATTIYAGRDGEYTVRLTATDNAGNTSSDDMTFIWDTTAPVVTFDSPTDGAYANQSTVPVTWRADGVIQNTQTTEELTIEGQNTITRTFIDEAGNQGTASIVVTRDTIAPTVSAGADKNINTEGLQVGSASDTNGLASVEWSQVSGPGTVFISNASDSMTSISATHDGEYTLRLTATDNAGNVSTDDMTFVWDVSAPLVLAGDDVVTNSPIIQVGSASDDNGIASVEWIGPQGVNFGNSTELTTSISADIEGVYDLMLLVTDNAGNMSGSSLIFTWDTTAPTVSAGDDIATNSQFTQTGEADDINGIKTYEWSQVSGPGTAIFGSPNKETTTISAPVDGTYILQLTATDNAGNTVTGDMTLTWDTSAPTTGRSLSRAANSLGWHNSNLYLTLTPDTGLAAPNNTYYRKGTTGEFTEYSIAIQVTTEGTNTYYYYSEDNAGNKEAPPKSVTIKLDKSKPTIPSNYMSPSIPAKGKYAKAYFKVGDKYSPEVYTTVEIRTTGGKVLKGPFKLGSRTKGTLYYKSIQMPSTAGTYVYRVIAKDYAGHTLIKDRSFTVK